MTDHFVQIDMGATSYRFFGLGVWKVRHPHRQWKTINAIYVPGEALRVAASQCAPAPRETDNGHQFDRLHRMGKGF